MKPRLNEWASNTIWFNTTMQFEGCKAISSIGNFDNVIANLGSSSGFYAFNYNAIGVKGINLALPRQSLFADREMIKNYFSYLQNGAVVIIPLCLFSSLEGEDCDFPDSYYMLLQSESIPNYSWKKKLRIQRIYNDPILFFPLFSLVQELRRTMSFRRNPKIDNHQMETDANNWIKDWMREFRITDFDREFSLVNKDSFESASRILNEIIYFCIDRELKPVIVIPPISRFLSAKVDERMRKKLITDFVNQTDRTIVPFINYLDDNEFADSKFFMNSYFLNEDGAALFTKRVISDLKKIGYIL